MDTKTLCLGVLSLGDFSGYEIKKAFEEGPFAHIHQTSFGSVYPALTRLGEEGLVTGTELSQEKRPDKKVYRITDAGRAAFLEALMKPPARDRFRSDFLFLLFFAESLPPDRLAGLIDARIAWYRGNLARMEGCDRSACTAGQNFVRDMGVAVYRAAADYLEANRQALLDQVSNPNRLVAE